MAEFPETVSPSRACDFASYFVVVAIPKFYSEAEAHCCEGSPSLLA